jgi:hypothetical protein
VDRKAGTRKGCEDAEQHAAQDDIADDNGGQPGRLGGSLAGVADEQDQYRVPEQKAGLT